MDLVGFFSNLGDPRREAPAKRGGEILAGRGRRLWTGLSMLMLLGACGSPASQVGERPAADVGLAPEAAPAPTPEEVEAARWRHLTEPETPPLKGELSEAERAQVEALIAALPGERGQELTAIMAYGPGIEPQVMALLDDPDPLRRAQAVVMVHRLRLVGATKKVVGMAQDKDARVKRAVMDVIADHGDPAMIRSLEGLVDSDDPTERMRASRLMGEHGVRSSVPALRKRAEVERRVWRLRTLEALVEMAQPQDYAWFEKQSKDATLGRSYNEDVTIWRGMAASDPVKAYKALKAERALQGDKLSDRIETTAMMEIAPHVPAEEVLERVRASVEPRYRPRLRNLVRALALTPGDEAASEVALLVARDQYTCDVIGARLEREAQLERRIAQLKVAAADPEEGADPALLKARLEQLEADLAWLRPLADNAASKLASRMTSKAPCRGELGALTRARLEGAIRPLLASPEASARKGAAALVSRHGGWVDAPSIMAVMWDSDEEVRDKAREAMRHILGHDLRLPGGYAWDSWYARTFGPVPAAHFPVKDRAAAAREDYARSLVARPPASATSLPSLRPGPVKKGAPLPEGHPRPLTPKKEADAGP